MFRTFAEVGMPFIPWLSILVIVFSFPGAIGLIKYRLWGFYGLYLTYLFGTLIAWLQLWGQAFNLDNIKKQDLSLYYPKI